MEKGQGESRLIPDKEERVKSQSIVQNIINNNYNINNVTNTGSSQATSRRSERRPSVKGLKVLENVDAEDAPRKEQKGDPQTQADPLGEPEETALNINLENLEQFKMKSQRDSDSEQGSDDLERGSEFKTKKEQVNYSFMNENAKALFEGGSETKQVQEKSIRNLLKREPDNIMLTVTDLERTLGETDTKGQSIRSELKEVSEESEKGAEEEQPNRTNPFFDQEVINQKGEMYLPVPGRSLKKLNKTSQRELSRPTFIPFSSSLFLNRPKSKINSKIKDMKNLILETAKNEENFSSSESDVVYDDGLFDASDSLDFDSATQRVDSTKLSPTMSRDRSLERFPRHMRKNTVQIEHTQLGGSDVRQKRFYSRKVSQANSIIRSKFKMGIGSISRQFKDLVYICEKKKKILKILQMRRDCIEFYSNNNCKLYLTIKSRDITKVVVSEKDSFLASIHYRDHARKAPKRDKVLILESASLRKVLILLRKQGVDHLICSAKSLKQEGDDSFKNSSFNIFPKSLKQGFLQMFVDTFFSDWKPFFVALVDKTLFVFPLEDKTKYADYRSILRKVKIYRLISINVVENTKKIGLNMPFVFAIKIKNEKTDLIFSAYNRSEKKEC